MVLLVSSSMKKHAYFCLSIGGTHVLIIQMDDELLWTSLQVCEKYEKSMRDVCQDQRCCKPLWARPLAAMASRNTYMGACIIVKQICCIWAGPARLGQRMRGEWSNGFAHILCYVERMNMCETRMWNSCPTHALEISLCETQVFFFCMWNRSPATPGHYYSVTTIREASLKKSDQFRFHLSSM